MSALHVLPKTLYGCEGKATKFTRKLLMKVPFMSIKSELLSERSVASRNIATKLPLLNFPLAGQICCSNGGQVIPQYLILCHRTPEFARGGHSYGGEKTCTLTRGG